MIKKRIETLRKKFDEFDIDGYVIPKNDEFFSEYAQKDRLKIISNFTGSAGFAIILKKKIIYSWMADIQSKQRSSQGIFLK